MALEPPQIPGLTDWRPLARGGFAVVWQARQETLDRLVAVKVDQRRLDVESERLRFLREAGAAGRMSSHPGIVTVHDAGILSDDRPYLVMELCPGGSLTSYLDSHNRPTQPRVRAIGVRIADALAAIHARGVLHRDVKPANILIDAYDQVGLADFGLAAQSGPGLAAVETFQDLTPAYTAPEILRRQPPTQFGDVYSLAATLYALLGGRPPRWPTSQTPSVVEVLAEQQQPLQPLPDVDPGLMNLLEQALAIDPGERPTAAEFRDRLAALPLAPVQSREATSAVPARTGSGPRRRAEVEVAARGRGRVVLVSLVGLVLLAVLVGALVMANRGPVVANPAPDPSVSSAPSPTASPAESSSSPPTLPATVPTGFEDCTAELGENSFCPSAAECWAGVISVFDLPSLGTPRGCDETHVYQTFAAGMLDTDVRRQSQLEEDDRVSELCSADTLEGLLTEPDRRTSWEILPLPPQEADGSDRIFRCLFGRGDRSRSVALREPS